MSCFQALAVIRGGIPCIFPVYQGIRGDEFARDCVHHDSLSVISVPRFLWGRKSSGSAGFWVSPGLRTNVGLVRVDAPVIVHEMLAGLRDVRPIKLVVAPNSCC